MNRRALVAIKVQPRSRIVSRFALQVDRSRARCYYALDQRIQTQELVITELMTIRDDVVSATRGAVQQIREAEALAENARHVVHAVIRYNYEYCFLSEWTRLN